MISVRELVQKILASRYECEQGKLEHDLSFAALTQRCQILEDALVREKDRYARLERQLKIRQPLKIVRDES